MISVGEKTPLEFEREKVTGRKIMAQSYLELDRDRAWQELQKGSLLRYISHGMTKFGDLPEKWEVGKKKSTKVHASLFGKIPLGEQNYSVVFTEIDHNNFVARTQEAGEGVKIWNHTMKMSPQGTGTLYTDIIEIYNGWLNTIITSAHVSLLYKYRHQRWQDVVRIIELGEDPDTELYKNIPKI